MQSLLAESAIFTMEGVKKNISNNLKTIEQTTILYYFIYACQFFAKYYVMNKIINNLLKNRKEKKNNKTLIKNCIYRNLTSYKQINKYKIEVSETLIEL